MKFRVERDVLADAVAWAARSLPVRPSVPVLAGLLIEASHEGLVLSTFDYETSARATLAAEVSDEGRALRDKAKLSQSELAVKLQVDVMTISRWERDERAISPVTALAIEHILTCPQPKRIA